MRLGTAMLVATLAAGVVACGGATEGESSLDAGSADASTDHTDATPSTDAAPDVADAVPSLVDAATDAGTACDQYCAAIMRACTGANAQYPDVASCAAACSSMDPGKPIDTNGDTLACRRGFVELAKVTPNPYCWNAGPFGYGRCGEPCDAFCRMAASTCSPAGGFDAGAPPYNSEGDCILHCAAYTMIDTPTNGASQGSFVAGGYGANGPAAGDTLDCREYYLVRSLQGAAAQQASCGDVGPTSGTCR